MERLIRKLVMDCKSLLFAVEFFKVFFFLDGRREWGP